MKRRGATKKPVVVTSSSGSDLSDAEEPIPSKVLKRQKERKSAAKAKPSDGAAARKAAAKAEGGKKSAGKLAPVEISDFFKNASGSRQQPADSKSQRFDAVVESCADDFESPKKGREKRPSEISSDLEDVLGMDTVSVSVGKKAKKDKPAPGKKAKASDASKSTARQRYAQMMQREGPRALGSKTIPEGKEGCLKGLTFVISGIFDSITADDCKALITKLGGRVTTAVSSKTNYLLLGRDAGATKSNKANELKIPILDDDGFFDLIRKFSGPTEQPQKKEEEKKIHKQSPGKPSEAGEKSSSSRFSYAAFMQREGPRALGSKAIPEGKEDCLSGLTFVISGVIDTITREDCKALIERLGGRVTSAVSHKTNYLVLGRDAGATKIAKAKEFGIEALDDDAFYDVIRRRSAAMPGKETKKEKKAGKKEKSPQVDVQRDVAPQLWVEKYKPQSLKAVIGQQGPKSCLNKLLHWLRNWQGGKGGKKATGKKWAGASDDGSAFRAALLSGAPGIGKTTTAVLCCKELGLPYVELNASDTRSKKLLEQFFSSSLSSHSIDYYLEGEGVHKAPDTGVDHVLIMDEVDGMSGNEDRAGMQELIALIKRTRVPIICICNDRQNTKVRSLANYCFDLRFHRPQTLQIRAAMMSIAAKEGLKISGPAVDQLIEAAQHDIRQVLHNLNLITVHEKSVSFDEARVTARKDVFENIFEATRKLFTSSESLSLNDRAELFFADYSLVPLFVQENYLNSVPSAGSDPVSRMHITAEAAKLIAVGDQIDRQIRTLANWSLLNAQSCFSAALPTELTKGYLQGRINFPSWFGRNSKTSRLARQLQQLHFHTSIRAPLDTAALNLDYMDVLRDRLVGNLAHGRIDDAVKICEAYDLSKDDVDTIMELGNWPDGRKEPMSKVSTKAKSAFTRALNSSQHLLPYDTLAIGGRRKKVDALTDGIINGQEGGEEAEEYNAAQLEEGSDESDDDTQALLTRAKVKGSAAKVGKKSATSKSNTRRA